MIKSGLFFSLLVLLIPITFLTTVGFFVWSVHLLVMINRKWKSYKSALRCMQEEDSPHKLTIYNCRTEFVKMVFLFFMNLIEFSGFFFSFVMHIVTFLFQDVIHKNGSNYFIHEHLYYISFPNHFNNSNNMLYPVLILPKIYNLCFASVLILFACMCMYLSSRYARKSWMNANKIPYLIVIFLLFEVSTQILSLSCTTYIIACWCENFLLIASLVIALKQNKELIMVINWLISDLRTTGDTYLLNRQIKMKQMFTRTVNILKVGAILLITSEILYSIAYTLAIILRENTYSSLSYLSLCEKSSFIIPHFRLIFLILHWTGFILATIGSCTILIPYIGYGLVKMFIILWRKFGGKTGYRTHFHNDLNVPLTK